MVAPRIEGVGLADDLAHDHSLGVDEERLRDAEHPVGDGGAAARVGEIVGGLRHPDLPKIGQSVCSGSSWYPIWTKRTPSSAKESAVATSSVVLVTALQAP